MNETVEAAANSSRHRSDSDKKNSLTEWVCGVPVGWWAILLIGLVFVAYLPAVHGGFIWDDDDHVTKPELRSLQGLWRIWFDLGATQQYYPLLHSAFWLEHWLWGDATIGYHIANILLHGSSACLLLLILRRLKIPGAPLAAAIFALHPIYVESVAWITEQKNTLSGVLYFAAMLVYLRFDREHRAGRYLQALGLFILGLLSKTVVATLPGALLVIFWWERGRVSWRRDVVPLVPWFFLGGIAGLFTAWVERTLIGAQGVPFRLTLVQRFLLAGRVIWFYLGKLLWPVDLIFIYPRWELNPMWWWQYCFPLAAIALLAILWLVRRAYRGPLAAILFFIGSLFPVLGFLNIFPFIYSFVADHFQYLPSVGIVVLVSAGVVRVLDRASKRARIAGQILCVTLLGTLMVLTRQQSRMYSDVRRLYETTLARNPGCIMCHINLGVFLSNSGQSEAAIQHYDAVVHLRPNSSAAAVAHNNIGIALIQVGQTWEAIHHYEEALRINPNYGYAHYNMGNALLKADLMPEATRHYEVAVKMSPNFPEAHNALGYVMFLKGNYFKAKEHYEAALRIRPGFAPALYNMSLLPAGSTEPRQN